MDARLKSELGVSLDVEDVSQWGVELNLLKTRLGQHFVRLEPRQRAIRYLQGLMSQVPRKNGWQLAEQAGDTTPDGIQRLLGTSVWDAEAVRDELQVLAIAKRDLMETDRRWAHAETQIAALPSETWQRLSAGQGAKGPRLYDWAMFTPEP